MRRNGQFYAYENSFGLLQMSCKFCWYFYRL